MTNKYWTTTVTKYEHYRDADNWSCCNKDSWEVASESLEGLHNKILYFIKGETEENRWGEYITYEWSDFVFVDEIERVSVDSRNDIIGYAEYKAEREENKERCGKEKQELAAKEEFERAYKELQAKIQKYIRGEQ